MSKIEYKLGVTLKLHPDDPKSYDFLRVDVGVSDVNPDVDVEAQMVTAFEVTSEVIAPAVEKIVAEQIANSGNVAIEGTGLGTVIADLRVDMGAAWTKLAQRINKLEGKKKK